MNTVVTHRREQVSLTRSDWPLVSVIVVNYNGGERLPSCLESLASDTYPAQQIVVVDNASTDDSRTILNNFTRLHREITVLWSARNLGYAGAVNLGLGSTEGEFIAVLNMDVTVERGWLKPLVRVFESRPEIAAVNPLIVLADGKGINAAGQDIHITGLGFNRGLGELASSIDGEPFSVSGIQGGAFLIRRTLLEKIGGMDTTGFLYHEDVNLSWLLRLMGFHFCCVPESVVHHDYFLTMYPAKLHLLERNRWSMLLAYLRRPSLMLLSPALLMTEILMWCYCFVRGTGFLQAKIESYRWILQHWPQIKTRRRIAESLRVVSDWKVLKNLHWMYAFGQFATLGRERGASRRQPVGGLPKEVVND